MSETANQMADAFEAEANVAPVVNVSGVDAPTVTTTEPTSNQKDRSQEKDKLYPEIERLKEEVLSLKKDKEEKAARKAAEEAEKTASKAAKYKAKLEDDLDAKELLKIKEAEWQEQLARERQERETAFALLEREKEFANLQSYRQHLLDTERDNIIPQLVDFIQGNTQEELAQSVEQLKERSASILESAQAALQQQRRDMRGTSATLPPAGPLETNSEQRMPTAEEIAAMPMNEYAKYRNRILSPNAQGKSRGLLG